MSSSGEKAGERGEPALLDEQGGPVPASGGVEDAFEIERASATPIVMTPTAAPVERSASPRESALSPPLDVLERWFSGVVTHPGGTAEGIALACDMISAEPIDVERIVTRGPLLSAEERLGLYQYSYFARLVECIADDYPVLAKALGESTFERIARGYIEAHPSTGPNLNRYSRRFSEFISKAKMEIPHRAFAADLARLEWSMVEVVHAPESGTLSLARLQELDADRWHLVRLPPAATLRFLEFSYPVNRFLQAMRNGEGPKIPEAAWSATAIYRQRYTIWRMDFTRAMAGVLSALLGGRTLGEAMDTLDDQGAVEGDVMAWFRAWVSGGFFDRVDLSAASGH
jgi:hypothetical protein